VFCRRSLLPAAALLALCFAPPAAAAPTSRIVNGTEAGPTDYPAQGYLEVDRPGPFVERCGGTLVGTRQFLTAARCAKADEDFPERFSVTLGELNLDPPNRDVYGVADVDVYSTYDSSTERGDVAMLTLDRPAAVYAVMRVVDLGETDPWRPGATATILGWGATEYNGDASNRLLEAAVPIRTDAECETAYETPFFDVETMLCAGAADPDQGSSDSCQEDWGGPLLVLDGSGSRALAGVFSTGFECNREGFPGVYARIGDDPLNSWVHSRTPEANFRFDHAPRANEPVNLISTSRHPEGAGYFTTFRWDLDGDGGFERSSASGTATHSFPAAGQQIVGIEASRAGGDKATAYFAFTVGADPNAPPSSQLAPPGATPAPAVAKPAGFLATIRSAKRPKVRRGRFNLSVRFARTAPAGIAVVEVFRGKRRIGIARARVRRGGTRRISVKLTPAGRRLLARSTTKRLKLRVRVRVGRRVLRSKTLTVRR